MPALPESIFDAAYLIFAIASGVTLLRRAKGRHLVRLLGWMALILGCGDAFHLAPRILNYWVEGQWTAALGIGKLVTSITMTVFYLLLEYARRERYGIRGEGSALYAVWALALVRIALCCFPQNAWTSADAPLSWGIYRNIPFALLGALTVCLWLASARQDRPLRHLWLAVLLSFLFYFPVVLFAQQAPLIGMMMLPKTCMYIWMICMFRQAEKIPAP